jgi:serine/threonine-protein kinase
MIGRVVGTNYRILEKIGEGGMGAVYRAVDQMLERDVAIKAIRPELAREPEIIERFRAEARTLARIHHSAIANVYSFFYEGEELFLAMELVGGHSLAKVLAAEGAIPWERAIALLATAMDGIQVAHDAGIVHRDLKPENLMVTEAGTLKVMDFGIARVMGSGHLTRTGLLVGTLRYMSPERVRGEEVDGRADVYALGAVLYEMLTGRPPFEGTSDWAILRAQIEDTPRPPSEKVPLLPWWIDRAVLKALAKEPAERFQTVEEMRRTLIRQGETMPGRPAPVRPESLEELPTVVTPPGVRTPTPPPVPPPAVTPPQSLLTPPPPIPPGVLSGPAPSSYRPVEIAIPRQGVFGQAAGKMIAAAALVAALLGIGGVAALWLTRDKPAEVALDTPEPQEEEESVQVAAKPAPTPVQRPSQTAPPPPLPEPREEEPASPAPAKEEPAQTVGAYTPPAQDPEPSPVEAAPMEEMRRLSGELQTESAQLIDTYQAFLDAKDEADQAITDNDELLQEQIEELAETAERFHKQLEGGGFIGRLRKRSGDDLIKVRQRGRELNRRGEQLDALMSQVQPNLEVRQAWQSIRRKWKRMAQIAASLR